MIKYGLIGKTLKHSFSQKYFREKFEREEMKDHDYLLIELPDISEFPDVWDRHPELKGLNVTIPYKQLVMPFLQDLDPSAERTGAVNVVKKMPDGSLRGFNSDYYGFKTSLVAFLGHQPNPLRALVLGSGGASKAIHVALQDLNIKSLVVSRDATAGDLTYTKLKCDPEILETHQLVVNTTPLGMFPKADFCPDLDFSRIGPNHFIYDLVYNPTTTKLMYLAADRGASVTNGLEMLRLQAEKSWDIWNKK